MKWDLKKRLVAWASLAAALGMFTASASAAPSKYGFDPVLSLTGGCTVEAVDPVPDPGCEPPLGGHPPASFSRPRGITADGYGNIYVANYGGNVEGKQGRIDIFDPNGVYITEILAPGVTQVAVDGQGNLYTLQLSPVTGTPDLNLFPPTGSYEPSEGAIAYGDPPTPVRKFGHTVSIAVNPIDDHLLVNEGPAIIEFSSAADGNTVLNEEIGSGIMHGGLGASIAIDAGRSRLYASDYIPAAGEGVVRIFELAAPHALIETFDGSETPGGKFSIQPAIALDEGTGGVFVYDGGGGGQKQVFVFDEESKYTSRIEYGIKDVEGVAQIWVDNGINSPNGVLDPEGRSLFVPSLALTGGAIDHVLAYAPVEVTPAEVLSASVAQVSRSDAELRATIEPGGAPTTYTFEYTTQERFEADGFTGAAIAGSGETEGEVIEAKVAAAATGLSAGATYRFRIVASNEVGSDEAEGTFTTYPEALGLPPCPNDALRTGLSAPLPDCRAYELVTPADTNARSPFGLGHLGTYFPTRESSPAGDKVSFEIEGGVLPGTEATGNINGDPYLATREADGWSSASAGPSGAEAALVVPGSPSPDQGYSFWGTGVQGTAVIGGKETYYVRYPDGHSELVGRGSLKDDPRASGHLISEEGGHIIFSGGRTGFPAVKLEPDAPPSGTRAIYDRTADEVTHVVSLLPGNATPAAGQNADYDGASLDGRGVAFTIGSKLYLRYDNEETYEVGDGVAFAGVAEGGNRIFYREGGKLIRFDALTGNRTDFNSIGTTIPVNVSADGSAAYLVSTSVLTTKANPLGDKAKAGQQNLYLSKEGTIAFVGIVTERDVEGDTSTEGSGGFAFGGLGLWLKAMGGNFAIDPSRTTPDGHAIVFESRAELTGYETDGHAQVYRYDSVAPTLECLSCIPTGAPATGEASLQSISQGRGEPEPLNSFASTNNLRADGRRAFFQSTEALVPEDTDGLQDIYEWEEQGVGSCSRAQDCIYLISSGHSERLDYLYAVSDNGDDVFFRTSDLLLASDADETPSIYDARAGGGFVETAGEPCPATQACPGVLSPAPTFNTPGSRNTGSTVPPSIHCPKGKHKVKRHGKVRCVKKHQKKKHRKHKANAKKEAGK
jgi:hypothetical protein